MKTKENVQNSPTMYKDIMLNNNFSLIKKVMFIGDIAKLACRNSFETGYNQANSERSVDEISKSLHTAINAYRSEVFSAFRRHIINQLLAYDCPLKSKFSLNVPFNTDSREFDNKGLVNIKLEFFLVSSGNEVEVDGEKYNTAQLETRIGRHKIYNMLPRVILPLVTLHNCTETKPHITFMKNAQGKFNSVTVEMSLNTFGLVQFLNPLNTDDVIEDTFDIFGKTIEQWQRVLTHIGSSKEEIQQTINYDLDFNNDLCLLFNETIQSTGFISFIEQPIDYVKWGGR